MASICNITGTITDGKGVPLDGKLVIQLDAPIINEDANPDEFRTTDPFEETITAGVVDIDLMETETAKVTYWFRFYKSDGAGGYEETPHKDLNFHEIVPDADSYPWAYLKPTGITTDNISTGAIRVAKQIMLNPALASLVGEATKLYRGATPPVTTIADVLWIKDGERSQWFYNASDSRWESNKLTVSAAVDGMAENGSLLVEIPTLEDYSQITLLGVRLRAVAIAPNDASNHWIFRAGYQEASSASLTAVTSDYNTGAISPSVLLNQYIPKNQLLNLSTVHRFGFSYNKLGSPGDLDLQVSFEFAFIYPEV